MRLTINLVARGRPEPLKRTLETTLKNIRAQTTLMVSADDDDPAVIEAAKSFDVLVSVKPREDTVGAKYNRALKEAPADVYMPLQDTAPHVTPGFDEKVLEAASLFPDGIGCVYGNMGCLAFPHSQSVTAGLVAKLGYWYPECFPYWFVDHWIDDIARMIDRISFADISQTVENHVTQERRELKFWTVFFDCCAIVRREQARLIIDSPEFLEPDWRKELLRRHYPLHEFRSLWINNEVRQSGFQEATGPGGPRYDRVKANAMAMLQQLLPQMNLTAAVAA